MLGLPGCFEYSRSVEESMNVGHCWCDKSGKASGRDSVADVASLTWAIQ